MKFFFGRHPPEGYHPKAGTAFSRSLDGLEWGMGSVFFSSCSIIVALPMNGKYFFYSFYLFTELAV